MFRHGNSLNATPVLRQCRCAQTISPGPERRVLRRPRPSVDDNVHVDSLRKTLDAHDNANRASLIREVRGFDTWREATTVRPSFLESPEKSQSPASSQNKLGPGYRHVWFKAARKSSKLGLIRKLGFHERPGVAAQLYAEWKLQNGESQLQYPWMDFVHQAEGDGNARLNTEILAFCDFMSPTQQELESATNAKKTLKRRIKNILPYFTTELVGSSATGLAHPLSDIDLHISLSPDAPSGLDYSYPLNRIYDGLKGSDNDGFSAFELLKARVSVLRFKHRPSGLRFEIQTGNDCVVSKQYVRDYITEFPNLRPLYALIKWALEMRGMIKVFGGGPGSYGLLMMIVASLKHGHASSSADDLSRQLFYFLDMFANLDFHKTCISVDPPEFFPKHKPNAKQKADGKKIDDWVERGQFLISKTSTKEPYLMCLQDPADPWNDLGRRSYSIQSVQKVFGEILRNLKREMELWDQNGPTKQHTILGPAVGANWRYFLDERKRAGNFHESMP
jgi:non-canonical poly(A) RNA polymerase PAPD5/7